ncbi:aminotransferase class V-fold PLP-dependent enzyme [Nakamurella leprariae]|uniref:Aminotransferase class V-fold PLP-dependent enzyme n=1 Tax=Nakamurella leprariae TaxID=2803911 RepID=A0A938YA46_9ACTN|nr:aminotransferase class V-fold PLP-dependent enzyme [Nakamurella leprariae]MBM9465831.1 aminotransferase class V-fold PLP-dependent enzyme [Nakamurella leprariae]
MSQVSTQHAAQSLLVGTGTEVPLVQGGSTDYVNLDYAASAPALREVAEHVAALLPLYSSIHRGAGYLSQVCTEVYEAARTTVAAFVGARADDVVIFTRNTTDSLNLLARSVPGDTVVLDIEHHANFLPWLGTGGGRTVVAEPTVGATLAALEAELRRTTAALVAVTGASNVTGESLPLRRVAEIAHRHGARLAVDGAQLLPHRRVDLAATGIDYLAVSGHKLYAPYGAGALIGRRDWLDAAEPHLAGGGAVRAVTVDGATWTDSPARHEAGSPNLIGAAALAKACQVLGALPEAQQEAREAALLQRLRTGLAELGIEPLRIWGQEDDETGGAAGETEDTVAIVTFTVPGWTAEEVATYLSAEHGIGVRDGRFCAHPLLRRLTGAATAIRASVGLDTDERAIDRLLGALAALLTDGPRWTYATADGAVVPFPETRTLPAFLGGSVLRDLASGASACLDDEPDVEPAELVTTV